MGCLLLSCLERWGVKLPFSVRQCILPAVQIINVEVEAGCCAGLPLVFSTVGKVTFISVLRPKARPVVTQAVKCLRRQKFGLIVLIDRSFKNNL